MEVTLFGIVREVKPEQLEKAAPPMEVTPCGMKEFLHPKIRVLLAVSIRALQLSRESYVGLPSSTIIDVKLVQPLMAPNSILVTLLGTTISVISLPFIYRW